MNAAVSIGNAEYDAPIPSLAGSENASVIQNGEWTKMKSESAPRTAVRFLGVEHVSKRFGTTSVLDNVSVEVHQGEFLTLLGPSGSGKTTLLMMIAGFLEPTAGRIMLGNRDISRIAPEGRGFGMVFQGYALFPHMTVAENVSFPLRIRRIGREEIRGRVLQALDMVQLSPLADRYPRQLSGGQQQRVALARALVFQPDLLLLDEPLGALDRKLRVEMQMELKQLHRRLGTSFVYVTHDQEEALSMSDRIAVLHGGRLAQVDTPETIYERPATKFVADFLGESNFLEGTVTRSATTGIVYRAEGVELLHSCRDCNVVPGDSILIALRPESVKLSDSKPPNENALPVRVADWSYYGSRIKGVLRTATDTTIAVNIAAADFSTPTTEGSTHWLTWSANASVLVTRD